MKNIQKQYQDLLEGKMSKSNFMRNVRMQFPQHISSVNSFEDSVKILKGKRILSEAKIEELLPSTRQSAFDKAKFQAQNAYQIDDKGKLQKDPLLKQDRDKKAGLFSTHIDPEVVKKVKAIMSGAGDRNVEIYLTRFMDENNEPYVKFVVVDNKGGGRAEFEIKKDTYKVKSGEVNNELVPSVTRAIEYIQQNELKDPVKKEKGLNQAQIEGDEETDAMIAKAEREREEEEGIKGGFGIQDPLEESYKDFSNNELASYVGTLKNELNAEKDPKKVDLIKKDLEHVKAELEQRKKTKGKSLNEAKQPIGVYGHNPNAEAEVSRGIDHLNYYQVYRGLQYELAKMPEITDANYIKARKKVVDTILKDSDAYKDLQLANFKAVKEMDEDLKMKDVKKDNLNDKPNEMKVMKKDEKGNTQDTLGKKENRKSKTAKIPVMTQAPKGKLEAFATPGKEKVMALKEHILDELTKPNETKEYINKGSRVKKKGLKGYDKEQVGNVIDFDGDTATVIWDKDSDEWEKATAEWNRDQEGENPDTTFGHHVQVNVLTKKDIPEHPKAKEKFGQIPDSPFMKKEEESRESKMKGLKEKLMKTVKELFKKGKTVVTATTPQSMSALKQAGYTEIPNTQDVRPV